MQLKIVIELDNDAFLNRGKDTEVARILTNVAGECFKNFMNLDEMKLRDINGNTVGHCSIEEF